MAKTTKAITGFTPDYDEVQNYVQKKLGLRLALFNRDYYAKAQKEIWRNI